MEIKLDTTFHSNSTEIQVNFSITPPLFADKLKVSVWQSMGDLRCQIGEKEILLCNNQLNYSFQIPLTYLTPPQDGFLLPPKIKAIEKMIWQDNSSYFLKITWSTGNQIWEQEWQLKKK